MIYHCEDHTCNYWDEGEKLPERCPQCGRKLLRANEADMTGDDWTALGNTLWDAEASDKSAWWIVFGKLHISAAHGAYAIWASAWSRETAWRRIRFRLFGFISRRWKWGA